MLGCYTCLSSLYRYCTDFAGLVTSIQFSRYRGRLCTGTSPACPAQTQAQAGTRPILTSVQVRVPDRVEGQIGYWLQLMHFDTTNNEPTQLRPLSGT